MKTVILNVGEAAKLRESGGYLSLRADDPVAAIVQLGSDIPVWLTFIAPRGKIWGMRFRVSDVQPAKEGAVLRDDRMQERICGIFPGSELYDLAPPIVVEACTSDPSRSVHTQLSGYYHLSSVIAADLSQAEEAIRRADAWLLNFPREAIGDMDDETLDAAGWLSPRAESQRPYARVLFAQPSIAKGMHGGDIDQLMDSLQKVLEAGVSLSRLQIDPRFLRMPKFSLGLTSAAMASAQLQSRLFELAELRARVAELLDSPLLFDDVAAERKRMDDDYKDFLVATAGDRIRASLDVYVSRWSEQLARAEIV